MGATLHQIHQTRLPAGGFTGLRQETFDTTEYRHWVEVFDAQFAAVPGESQFEVALRSLWLAHQATIHAGIATLATLADRLQAQAGPMVICHADLHPGNLIRDRAGQVLVIDWEDVMLALKERDFIFIKDALVTATTAPGDTPFFQGYGQRAIDWVALTYYLWERAVQDLIVSAQIVFHRDDVSETTKADELRVFRDTLAEGGTITNARAAAANLPSDLGLPPHDR